MNREPLFSLSWERIYAMVSKELRQLARDRPTFGMIVMIPLIQLLLFGYAINTNVRNLPVGYLDLSQTSISRQLVQDIAVTQVVQFTETYTNTKAAENALRQGRVRAALIIPEDITARAQSQRPMAQWLVDGSDSMVSSALLGLRNMPLELFKQQYVQNPPSLELALFFNPERRSAVNVVPGLVAIVLTMTMVLFTAAALVRERERGNLELLITTPVSSIEIMLGKIIPYIFVGLIQMTILLGLGYLIFSVPMNGSLAQVYLGVLAFICANLTLGLLISTLAQTQLQAMQITFFLLIPSILLSGFMFPYDGMPKAAQWIAEALPATHFIRIIRGIVLRGADLLDLWKDLVWLVGFTFVGVILAAKRFKKRLD